MRPMPVRRGPRESLLVGPIRDALRAAGWTVVQKIHVGSVLQDGDLAADFGMAGIPDLYCFKPPSRHQWVEVKRPKGGRLTRAQKIKFAEWEAAGLGVWVVTGPGDLGLLDGPPNWREWL